MKPKNILLFICILGWTICPAQNFDNYQKTWSTYFGGSGMRLNTSVTDTDGTIIATGDLVIPNAWLDDEDYYNQFVTADDLQFAFDPNLGNGQTIVVKFAQDGDLLWSGYLPFTIQFMEIDSSDNIYISGTTNSPNLATPGVWEETPSTSNEFNYSFIAKLNPDFTINWLTYTPIETALAFDLDNRFSNLYGVVS